MTEEMSDQPGVLWVDPTISSPRPNSTVSMEGFYVEAYGPPQLIGLWEVEVWGSTVRKYSIDASTIYMKMWIPGTDISAGTFHIRVRYQMAWVWSGWQECMNLRKTLFTPTLPVPAITHPAELEIVGPTPTIRGNCVAGATSVFIVFRTPLSGSLFAQISGTTWSVTTTEPLPAGVVTFQAYQQKFINGNNESSPGGPIRSIKVRPTMPVLASPKQGDSIAVTSYFTGTGTPGATINIVRHGYATPVLASVVVASNGVWTATVQLAPASFPPGTYQFSARQIFEGVDSPWLDPPRSVQVQSYLPREPTIVDPKSDRVHAPSMYAMGVTYGLDVTKVWVRGSGAGDSWEQEADLRADKVWIFIRTWEPGVRKIQASVLDSGVRSGWSDIREFRVYPPSLTIRPPSSSIAQDATIEVTGAYPGAELVLRWAGGESPFIAGEFKTTGTTSVFTPSEPWDVGEMTVIAEQYVDGVASFASSPRTFTVARPRPIITPIGEPIEGRHALTITRVASGTVTLQMEMVGGEKVDGTFTGSDTTRTFTPTAPWSPLREWRIRVVQQVGGSTSKEYSDFVTLTVKFSKPAITYPTSATVIREPQHAMSGTGLPGARVTLYHQNQGTSPLGSVDVLNDQTWNIPASALDRDFWMADPFNLMAIQRLGTADSEWSDVVGVPVIFKPIIDGVTVDGLKPTVRGSGGLKGAELQIWISGGEGGVQLTTTVRENGTWEVAATVDWAVKTHTITARQLTPVSKKESDWSDTLSFTIVDPKPPKPVITPVTQPIEGRFGLTITGVAAGTVTLTMLTGAGGAVAGEFTGTGSTRTFIPAAAWTPPGEQTVKVVQTVGGVPSDPSDLVTLKVRPPKPGIEPPSAPIEATQPLTVMGIYSDAVTLKMLDDDNNEVTGNFTGSGERRDFTPDPAWAAGEHHVKVVQTLQNITSAPSDLCTFIVDASLKPPVFEVPVAGSNSSSSPQISGTSEPYAEVTVQHVNGPELFTGPADADGKWAFVVKEHFDLGPQALEASQVHQGVGSGWSKEAHTFEVIQTPVNPPSIERPGNNSTVSPPFWFSGSGIGQAQVSLRVKQGNEVKGTDAVTVNGSRNWTSRPQFVLPSGITYTLEAQQRYGAEESGWTVPPRIFSVSASLFEFADAAPVIGQPVVENQESVWLRVRAVSVNTGRGVEGLEVRWYLEQQVELAMTLTDEHGWARYQYAPQVPGEHTVWADMSAENEQVTVVQPFSVMALQKDAWAREFDLFMNGERVDLATMELVFQYDKHYSFVLVPKPGSPLIGFTYVALEHLLSVTPRLGVPVDLDAEVVVHWDVIVHTQTSGFYGLKLTCPKLPDWQLPVRVISRDFANEVEVLFDGVAMGFGKSKAYPCHGATHTITVKLKPESPLLNKTVQLQWRGESAESLGISISPSLEYFPVLTPEGISWTLNCVNGLKNGDFSLALVSDDLGFTSLDFPLSLGHNKVKIIDWDGPTEIGIGGGWRRGICVASEFTGRVVSVPVTVLITGREPYTDTTSVTGWCYVVYPDDKTVDFKLHNRYEGQLLE
jgi:hypothetical protein